MTFDEMKKASKAVRKHKRRAVKINASVDVNGKLFSCTAYDVSLGGVRVKVDAPIFENENVSINFEDNLQHIAKVIWVSAGYAGLNFNDRPQKIKEHLSGITTNLS